MKHLISLILLFLSVNIYAQMSDKIPINCSDLHEGVFKLVGYEDIVYTIVRKKNKQRESIGKTGRISDYDVKWTSECTYLLFNPVLIAGKKEPEEDLVKIDTISNEIIGRNGDSITILSTVKSLDFETQSTMLKIDTSLLYRNITKFEKFKDFKGEIWSSTLLSGDFSIIYRQKSNTNEDFLLGFETLISIENRSFSQLLDHVLVKVTDQQKIATSNCKFEEKFDDEIVAIYESTSDENADNKIIKAWRFNRKSLKIETVETTKVQYKTGEKATLKKLRKD